MIDTRRNLWAPAVFCRCMDRRTRTAAVAAALTACAALMIASGAVARSASTSVTGPSGPVDTLDSATLTACAASSATQGAASFSAQMQALPGTSRMAISVSLYERAADGAAFTPVSAPGFDVWQISRAHIGVYTANENVVDLPVPGTYRAVAHFRWLNRQHRVFHHDQRTAPSCVLTAPAPDLFIVKLTHQLSTPPTTELYSVLVRNSGTAVGPFQVALSVGTTALPDQTVSSLAGATSQVVQFSGPRCTAGTTLTAQIDPSGLITEPANPARTESIVCGAG